MIREEHITELVKEGITKQIFNMCQERKTNKKKRKEDEVFEAIKRVTHRYAHNRAFRSNMLAKVPWELGDILGKAPEPILPQVEEQVLGVYLDHLALSDKKK